MIGMYYEHRQIIDSRDADGKGHCRPSALLGHLQEAATAAAETGGFGRGRLLEENGGFWMLARLWYRLDRPLLWGEEIMVRTWHRGGKGAMSYRDFDIFVGDQQVGEAVSAWVMASMADHKLMRLSGVKCMEGTDGGDLCKSITLAKIRTPKELTAVEQRLMRYSDTDINGHVNNTRYADFACDALSAQMLTEGQFLSSMQLGYLTECRPGQRLDILVGEQDGAFFVRGAAEGGACFDVKAVFTHIPE